MAHSVVCQANNQGEQLSLPLLRINFCINELSRLRVLGTIIYTAYSRLPRKQLRFRVLALSFKMSGCVGNKWSPPVLRQDLHHSRKMARNPSIVETTTRVDGSKSSTYVSLQNRRICPLLVCMLFVCMLLIVHPFPPIVFPLTS